MEHTIPYYNAKYIKYILRTISLTKMDNYYVKESIPISGSY
jgi:hypothetical protein